MSELSKIRKNGVDYDIKDSTARQEIETLKQSGVPGGNVELDTTLTQSGKAADAKAVGDALTKLERKIPTGAQSASNVSAYKWIPRGLMRDQIKIFQGWTHCVRYDERLGKAVGIVMAGNAAHDAEQPWYRVTIDDNGYMSDYKEITIYNTDGSTKYAPNNGYVCGFCILDDGTYLIQDNDFTTDSSPNFYKSTDYGKTFAKVDTVGIPTQAFGLRQLSTGRIISGSSGAKNRFYYSDDGGINWNESNVLDVSVLGKPPFEADSKYEFAEHCIVEFSNGKLLAIGRTSNNARDSAGVIRGNLEGAAVAYSDDYGATWRDFGWSKTITNMTSNNAACVCINGIYHLVMGDRYTYTKDKEGNRRYFAMYYQWATEEDALNDNWSEPVVIDYGHWTSAATTPTDSGYPSLWKDGSDNLHCVFYDGDGSGHAYGANWWLIDGNPCVQSKSAFDGGSGSLAVSYSQKQVETMLLAQKTNIMNIMMQYINDLYDKVGEMVPDSGANDGTNYITSDLLLYFNLVDTSKWDETGVYCAATYATYGDMYWHRTSLASLKLVDNYPALIRTPGAWNSAKETSTAPYPSVRTNVTLATLGVDSSSGFTLEFCGIANDNANQTYNYELTRTVDTTNFMGNTKVPTIVDGAISPVGCGASYSKTSGDIVHLMYVFTPAGITVYGDGTQLGSVVEIDNNQYETLKTVYVKITTQNGSGNTINRLYNAPLTADQCMNNYLWFKNFVESYELPEATTAE